ncbi:MAG: c-type cytochrome [Bdellovibrionia bacterium]
MKTGWIFLSVTLAVSIGVGSLWTAPCLGANETTGELRLDPLSAAAPLGAELILLSLDRKKTVFHQSELLQRADLVRIEVAHDPAYEGRKKTYDAIALKDLFQGMDLSQAEMIEFYCQDGFSAPIPKKVLLSDLPHSSKAYLAIEPLSSEASLESMSPSERSSAQPAQKWEPLAHQKGSTTPGPFYLIWTNPENSQIKREEWPFQVVRFELKKSLQEIYPRIFFESTNRVRPEVRRGLQVFSENCLACHTLNQQGPSHLGPDLNLPMNPTEYFKPQVLVQFIREPKSVRTWSESKMPAFGKDVLGDREVADLISYLRFMASHKQRSSTPPARSSLLRRR